MQLPLGIFAIAIGTVILPRLSSLFVIEDKASFSNTLDWSIRLILLIGIPAVVGLIMLAEPIILILFERGAFNSQDSLMRYDIKAMGLYAASSKNWITPLGNLGLHFGTNYNFVEVNDGDDDLNYFMGIDIEFNPELSLLMEYNAALNENDMTAKNIAINKGGYLNAAIRWTFVERLHIELDFNNLLFDEDRVDYFNRELKITYIEYF